MARPVAPAVGVSCRTVAATVTRPGAVYIHFIFHVAGETNLPRFCTLALSVLRCSRVIVYVPEEVVALVTVVVIEPDEWSELFLPVVKCIEFGPNLADRCAVSAPQPQGNQQQWDGVISDGRGARTTSLCHLSRKTFWKSVSGTNMTGFELVIISMSAKDVYVPPGILSH
ncbi:hypothetical protein KXW69_008306 [Aspergillus fumigatus]|nr:hypothetical protein KXW69_008306 [Aspergillus fumigatus]KAH2583075.1 hypothetical protein KXV99_008148 [Aspergillus fumigatus]KAH3156125.1 hypothetical protein KXV34_008003 [Aspergillus fumigatus]